MLQARAVDGHDVVLSQGHESVSEPIVPVGVIGHDLEVLLVDVQLPEGHGDAGGLEVGFQPVDGFLRQGLIVLSLKAEHVLGEPDEARQGRGVL